MGLFLYACLGKDALDLRTDSIFCDAHDIGDFLWRAAIAQQQRYTALRRTEPEHGSQNIFSGTLSSGRVHDEGDRGDGFSREAIESI